MSHEKQFSTQNKYVRKHVETLCIFEIDKDKEIVKVTHNQMHFFTFNRKYDLYKWFYFSHLEWLRDLTGT